VTSDVSATRPSEDGRRSTYEWIAAGVVSVVVLVVHFRPWQRGLLEEWGLVVAWNGEGWAGFTSRLGQLAGRPLHLLPHYLGLAASGGGFVGEYAVLALVALGLFLGAAWALRPILRGPLGWAVAALVALHPWWPAGAILRFLPAQVGVLGLVVLLGCLVRYLRGGSRWHLVLGPAALLVGLLTYQAMALTALVVVVVLAAVTAEATAGRRLAAVGVTVATVTADLVYTLAIAPRLSDAAYEASLTSGNAGAAVSIKAVLATTFAWAPIWGTLIVALAAVVLAWVTRLRRERRSEVLWLVAGLAGAPFTGLIYAANALHLNDPERIGLPVGTTAWVVLALALSCLAEEQRRAARAVAAGLALWALVAAVAWYGKWTHLATLQGELVDAVVDVRASTGPEDMVIVADRTGQYGDIYTLLPPHLDLALLAEGAPAGAVICTPDGVEREHPDAARYPLLTTPACSEVPEYAEAVEETRVDTPAGELTLLVVDR
jgi:hypothetical protein